MISTLLTFIPILLTLTRFSKGQIVPCKNGSLLFYSPLHSFDQTPVVYPPPSHPAESSTTPLYFGLMMAPNYYSNSTVSAVQLALDTINADPDLLRGYSLHYTLTTSQCLEHDLAEATVFQLLGTPDVCKLGLVEAGCTDTTASVARNHWAEQFNIPQITCSPTIQDFTDDQNKVFEVSPANDVIIPALIELITHYNWTKLALITENKREYSQIVDVQSIRNLNVTVTHILLNVVNGVISVEDSSGNSLFNDVKLEARIFILAMSSEVANSFLCKAFQFNITYPKYEFIFVSDHHSDWWVGSPQNDSHYGCSTVERAKVLNHSLALQNEELVKQALYCVDAVRVLAQAINNTISSDGYASHSCIYTNQPGSQVFFRNIQETILNGTTGEIRFGPTGRRLKGNNSFEVTVNQYQTANMSLRQVKVAVYANESLTLILNSTLWPSGIPYDGSLVPVLVTPSTILVAVFFAIATLGIIFAFVCCIFNFVCRNTKIVRLASPNLNYLIITGCVSAYISVYWYLLPTTDTTLVLTACLIEVWLLGVSNLIIIGTIFAKVWRVYYIFRNPDSTKKHTVTDCHLFAFVILLAVFGSLLSVVYIVVETVYPDAELEKVPNRDNLSAIVGERNVREFYEFYTCKRVPFARTIIICLMFGTVGILLGSALYMAFKTRKVRIKSLNDAKYITAIVYIVSLSVVLFVIFTFTLNDRVNTYPAARIGLVLLSVTIILLLVFLPKMINLYQDPEGEHVFSISDTRCPAAQPSIFLNKVECNGCKHLTTRVKTLERLLETKDKIRESEGNSIVLNSTNIGYRRSRAKVTPPLSFSISEDDMSYDDSNGIAVSWTEDECTYHIGHKV